MSDDSYVTIGIPTISLATGQTFIRDEDVYAVGPSAMEFIGRFSNYWTHDPIRCGWVSPKQAKDIE